MESLLTSKPQPQPARETRRTDGADGADQAPGPVASFIRFVVCGGGVGVLSSAAVPLLALAMPWAVANAVITVASTILCTELHALFTFGTGRRAGLRRHLQSAGSATAAYVVTCAAMFILHAVQSSPGMLWEQTVYLGAAGLAGIGRFLILRLFVFGGGKSRGEEGTPAPAVCAQRLIASSPSGTNVHRVIASRSSLSVIHPCQAISAGSGKTSSRTTASCTPSQYGLMAPRQRNLKANRTPARTPNSSPSSRAAASSYDSPTSAAPPISQLYWPGNRDIPSGRRCTRIRPSGSRQTVVETRCSHRFSMASPRSTTPSTRSHSSTRSTSSPMALTMAERYDNPVRAVLVMRPRR